VGIEPARARWAGKLACGSGARELVGDRQVVSDLGGLLGSSLIRRLDPPALWPTTPTHLSGSMSDLAPSFLALRPETRGFWLSLKN
jgi:hypothetical protein